MRYCYNCFIFVIILCCSYGKIYNDDFYVGGKRHQKVNNLIIAIYVDQITWVP